MYLRYFSDILGGAFFIYLPVYDIRPVYLAVLLKRLPAEYAAALHKAATILILLLYICFLLCSNDVFRFRFYIIFIKLSATAFLFQNIKPANRLSQFFRFRHNKAVKLPCHGFSVPRHKAGKLPVAVFSVST